MDFNTGGTWRRVGQWAKSLNSCLSCASSKKTTTLDISHLTKTNISILNSTFACSEFKNKLNLVDLSLRQSKNSKFWINYLPQLNIFLLFYRYNSWEPEKHIFDKNLITVFESKQWLTPAFITSFFVTVTVSQPSRTMNPPTMPWTPGKIEFYFIPRYGWNTNFCKPIRDSKSPTQNRTNNFPQMYTWDNGFLWTTNGF